MVGIRVVLIQKKIAGRDNSFFYGFTVHGVQKQVCMKSFLGILDVGEKFVLLKDMSPISSSQPDQKNKGSPRNQKTRVTEDK